jgi:hypothetical protein
MPEQLGRHPPRPASELHRIGLPGTTFQGTVPTIPPTINAQTRTFGQVQPINDQGQLRGGMLANLTIVTPRRKATA